MTASKKILIVDDSLVVRELVVRYLSESGFNSLETAVDGLDALSKLNEKKYDMVITDYDMPNINGRELIGIIKKKYPDTLIIMLSAQNEKNTIIHLMRQVENFISKDKIDSIQTELCSIVEKTFEKADLKKENERLFIELEKKNRKMQNELESARNILKEILKSPGIKSAIFHILNLCRQSNTIGGDFYLIRRKENKIRIILADISGHGIPAALLILTMKNAVDSVLSETTTNGIIDKLNGSLCTLFPETKYATVSCLELDESNGAVYYTNEFQNPIIYVRKDGEVIKISNGRYKMLGIYDDAMLGNKPFLSKMDILMMESGEKIILLTDGIVEIQNENEEEFGMERITGIIRDNHSLDAVKLTELLYKKAMEFARNNAQDDISIITVEKR